MKTRRQLLIELGRIHEAKRTRGDGFGTAQLYGARLALEWALGLEERASDIWPLKEEGEDGNL